MGLHSNASLTGLRLALVAMALVISSACGGGNGRGDGPDDGGTMGDDDDDMMIGDDDDDDDDMDGGIDAGSPDAGVDAGPEDAGVDAGPDGGIVCDDAGTVIAPRCWGDECSTVASASVECPGFPIDNRSCIVEDPESSVVVGVGGIGTADEPVRSSTDLSRDLPESELPGGMALDLTHWPGGYCTNVGIAGLGGCTSDVDCALPGGCEGRCLLRGETGDGDPITGCFQACDPSADGNDGCRDATMDAPGQQCSGRFGTGACIPGCVADLECQVAREDTDEDGVIDPYDAADNPDGDRLVWDRASRAFCDDGGCDPSYRCRSPGDPTASIGDACERASDCPEDGFCLIEELPEGSAARAFTDGYCLERGCEADADCPAGGVCQLKGFGERTCLQSCDFAAELGTADEIGVDGKGDGCRAGYNCAWIGEADATGDARTDGACLPGNYNAVTTPNVGADCDDDADCYSLLGNGFCREWTITLGGIPVETRGQCAMSDCVPEDDVLAAVLPAGTTVADATVLPPGIPADYCGEDTACVPIAGDVTDGTPPVQTQCLKTCNNASVCADGLACNDTLLGDSFTDGLCWIFCIDFSDPNGDGLANDVEDDYCRTGEFCSPFSGLCEPL